MQAALEVMKAVVPSTSMRGSGPALKQPTFNWKAQDKYNKVLDFEMRVNVLFRTKSFNICNSGRVPVIINWLGCEGIQFRQTLLGDEQEVCMSSAVKQNKLEHFFIVI